MKKLIILLICIVLIPYCHAVPGQIVDACDVPIEIVTVFDQNEIPNLQWAQSDDLMYLVDGTDPPQVLTRTSDSSWSISDVDFQTGPFQDENVTATTLAVGALTGSSKAIVASTPTFSDTAGSTHVGSIWQINQVGGNPAITGDFDVNTGNSVSIATKQFVGGYSFTTSGTWVGTITLQRSTNNGISWRNALAPLVDTNFDNPAETEEDGAAYRAVMSNYTSGTATYNITVTDDTNRGVVRITAVADACNATCTILNDLVSTAATTTWREPYWSDFDGWPKTVAFHQQRLVFGGSESFPQAIWFGKQDPDDYANFLEGTLDTSAFTVFLQGQNPIRWLLSQDYLIVASSDTIGLWGERGKAVTPTSPSYQEQTRHGAEAIQGVLGGDSVLYVERGARKIREFSFNLQVDKYLSPDLSILSPEITDGVIKEVAFQLRPEPILWCVMDDGNIATLTYQRDQSVVAWTKQTTDGNFESVAVIPSPTGIEDQVYVSVLRVIDACEVRYIEWFTPRDFGDDPNDAFFVDSGISYSGAATDTFTNANHLEGETVSIYADRLIESPEIVVGGGFTIDNAASRVLVGMPFTSKLETMPLVVDPQDRAFRKKVRVVWFDLYKTGYLQYGNGENATLTNMNFFNDLDADPNATAQDLYTSVFSMKKGPWTGFGSRQKQTIFIQSDQPMPLTLRSLTIDYELTPP